MGFFTKRIEVVGPLRKVVAVILGVVVGGIVAAQNNPLPLSNPRQILSEAHTIPKVPGGTSLRMAMVHDVLHERYWTHSPAWYQARLAKAQLVLNQPIAPGEKPSDEYLDALDDAAVALERSGRVAEAIPLMQRKLDLLPKSVNASTQLASDQFSDGDTEVVERIELDMILAAQKADAKRHHQYTAEANLGTFLLLKSLGPALAGNPAAIAEMRESLPHIRTSIALNPGAHFGRERWQAILVEHLLACIEHPDLLTKYDMVGNNFAAEVYRNHPSTRISRLRYALRDASDDTIDIHQRLWIRDQITAVGMSRDWAKVVHPEYPCPMPFDEPTLAIIGMWTIGGGPNPHFALALGQIMERVNQPEIAWNAYERAVEMQQQFWPDAKVREQFIAFCKKRQFAIAGRYGIPDPTGWQEKLRQTHTEELAWGRAQQSAYHEFETNQLAKGIAVDDPHFYDTFLASHPPIASDPGKADELVIVHHKARTPIDLLPSIVLTTGIFLTLATIFPGKSRPKVPAEDFTAGAVH